MNGLGKYKGRPKTKVVCTLGPSTEPEAVIRSLIESGMSVARLNLSHGNMEAHDEAIRMVRRVSDELEIPVGIMVDIPGTKYRTGPLEAGVIELVEGERFTLTSRDIVGTQEIVAVAPPGIHRDALPGRPVLLDDGLIELRVVEVIEEDVVCEIVIGGRVTERRGVTTPGKSPSQPFPDERAIVALKFAAEQNADFVALSTVVTGDDIHRAREILDHHGPKSYIISKVERAEALENFEDILDASDAIMVARGDMGVEVPLSQVPVIQKRLIRECNEIGKPVITATQMLESMIRSQVPTRAEVTDVANAIFDGTDAIMLSGETSVGLYPVQAVKVMVQVAYEAEAALPYSSILEDKAKQTLNHQTDDAIAYDAARTAHQLQAGVIVAFTESGSTPGRVAKYRPEPAIIALTPHVKTQRQLTLRWAVTPLIVEHTKTVEDFFDIAVDRAVSVGHVSAKTPIVLVAGVPIGIEGGTNLLHVLNVPEGDKS